MFKMPLHYIIARIKDQVLNTANKQALLMEFDVRLSIGYPFLNVTSKFSVLLYCPDGGRTHTFVMVNEELWKNTSNHDTCWESDGINSPLSELYFTMADEINMSLKDSGYEEMAPRDMNQSVYMTGKLWELVDIKLKKEPLGYSFEIVE